MGGGVAFARPDRGRGCAALLFPIAIGNDADVDSLANALAFAALALGLNIVVGFAGLLDLGYAAFFAIGAYSYGILSSWQLQPDWIELLGAVPVARTSSPATTRRPATSCISRCRSG